MILRAVGVLALLYLAFYFGTKYRDGDVSALKKAVKQCEKVCNR